jgi:hypothetical protein
MMHRAETGLDRSERRRSSKSRGGGNDRLKMTPSACRSLLHRGRRAPSGVGSRSMPQSEVQVACAWCGLFSDPGPVCDVCGSPLPDVAGPGESLSASSFLTPEELSQVLVEPPPEPAAAPPAAVSPAPQPPIPIPPPARRAAQTRGRALDPTKEPAAAQTPVPDQVAPELPVEQQAKPPAAAGRGWGWPWKRSGPGPDPEFAAEEEQLLKSWKTNLFGQDIDDAAPDSRADESSSSWLAPADTSAEPQAAQEATFQLTPQEAASPLSEEPEEGPKFMLWPWSRKPARPADLVGADVESAHESAEAVEASAQSTAVEEPETSPAPAAEVVEAPPEPVVEAPPEPVVEAPPEPDARLDEVVAESPPVTDEGDSAADQPSVLEDRARLLRRRWLRRSPPRQQTETEAPAASLEPVAMSVAGPDLASPDAPQVEDQRPEETSGVPEGVAAVADEFGLELTDERDSVDILESLIADSPDTAAEQQVPPDASADDADMRGGSWRLLPWWPRRRAAPNGISPYEADDETPEPLEEPAAAPTIEAPETRAQPVAPSVEGFDEALRRTLEKAAKEEEVVAPPESPAPQRRESSATAPRTPRKQVKRPPKESPPAEESGEKESPMIDPETVEGPMVVVMPTTVRCSRCGGPSERGLCDACHEAIRELRELSIDFQDGF